jgi:DNA-binding NarL/FixJ family response regulator
MASKDGLFNNAEWSEITRLCALTPRQSQIVMGICAGKSDKWIATELNIGIPTVRTHLTRLFVRLGLNDRSQLIVYVFGQFRHHFCRNCHTRLAEGVPADRRV